MQLSVYSKIQIKTLKIIRSDLSTGLICLYIIMFLGIFFVQIRIIQIFIYSFIHSLILFIHSFIHSFIYLFKSFGCRSFGVNAVKKMELIFIYLFIYHSDSERGNPLPLHGLLFPINSKGSFICTIPTDRITHTTAYVTPVVEHWQEREIAQWVHYEGRY